MMTSEEGTAMSDANEPLEDKVKRLEAEAEALRKQLAEVTADRDKYKEQFRAVAYDLSVREWEGITQEDLGAAMRNTGVLERVIAELEREGRGV
jgi:septal ring factor EnvC (AmiA/AmiB activator)